MIIDKFGYINIFQPKTKSYKAEHRLVMEQHLNRKLSEDEIVHHINEIKTDNRLCNLQVMNRYDHTLLHQLKIKTIY